MKRHTLHLAALTTLFASGQGNADVIYSGLQNITIPTTYGGTYIDVDGMTSSPSTFTGWDLNPFMGGVYLSNSATFQAARSGTGGMDTVLNFTSGTTIDSGLNFATGSGGSLDHLGTQFTAGTEGNLGFRLNGSNYGSMRVVFTNNNPGAVIKDWAYDNSGAAIKTDWIKTDVVSPTVQKVTLNPGTGDAFTLGSVLADASGSITNSVTKTGAGAVTLANANTYTGGTTINAGKLLVNNASGSGTGSGIVNVTAGTLGGTGTISGATTISSGAVQTAGDSVTLANNLGVGTIGKQTFTTSINFNEGSIFEWNLTANADTNIGTRGINYDAIDTASLAKTGSGAIFRVVLNAGQDFSEGFWNTTRTWEDIFKNGGSNLEIAPIFSSFEYFNASGELVTNPAAQGLFTINGTSLTWTAVPEPTSALAGLLLGAGLLRRRRNA